MISAKELLSIPNLQIFGTLPERVRGFANDTRTLVPGDAFLALQAQRDGHEFLHDAEYRQAACAIVQKIHPEISLPQILVPDVFDFAYQIAKIHRKNYPIISVTGSYGKTSTKDMLRLLLGNIAYATPENLNNLLGITLSLSQLDTECVGIIEAGIDHPGEMGPIIDLLHPDFAIITGISPVHLENFSTFDQLVLEKCKIANDTIERGKTCLIPESSLQYAPFRQIAERCIVISEHFLPQQRHTCFQWDPKSRHGILSGTYFGQKDFQLPVMSRGQVENFARAATVATLLGIDWDTIQSKILQWSPSAQRGEWHMLEGHAVYLDAYNANPTAMRDALEFFDQQQPGPNMYILGGMKELGERSIPEHIALAQYFRNHIDSIILTIGEEMMPFCEYLQNSSIEVVHYKDIALLKSDFTHQLHKSFQAIFIKGSHSYHLWKLLPSQE